MRVGGGGRDNECEQNGQRIETDGEIYTDRHNSDIFRLLFSPLFSGIFKPVML